VTGVTVAIPLREPDVQELEVTVPLPLLSCSPDTGDVASLEPSGVRSSSATAPGESDNFN
jgi:hypothetical protein